MKTTKIIQRVSVTTILISMFLSLNVWGQEPAAPAKAAPPVAPVAPVVPVVPVVPAVPSAPAPSAVEQPPSPTAKYESITNMAERFLAIDRDLNVEINGGFKNMSKIRPILDLRESLCKNELQLCLNIELWAKSSCAVSYVRQNDITGPFILWESVFKFIKTEQDGQKIWSQIRACSPKVASAQLNLMNQLLIKSKAGSWKGLYEQIAKGIVEHSAYKPVPADLTGSLVIVTEMLDHWRQSAPAPLRFLADLARNSEKWVDAENVKTVPIAIAGRWLRFTIQSFSAVGELSKIPPLVSVVVGNFGPELLKKEDGILPEQCAAAFALSKPDECKRFIDRYYGGVKKIAIEQQETERLINLGQYKEVEARLKAVLAKPNPADSWRVPYVELQLGYLNQYKGNYNEAQNHLNNFLKNKPTTYQDSIFALENSYYYTILQAQIHRGSKRFADGRKVLSTLRGLISRYVAGPYWGHVFVEYEELLLALHMKDRAQIEKSLKVYKTTLNNDSWEEFYRLAATAVEQKLRGESFEGTMRKLERTRGKTYPPYTYLVAALADSGKL